MVDVSLNQCKWCLISDLSLYHSQGQRRMIVIFLHLFDSMFSYAVLAVSVENSWPQLKMHVLMQNNRFSNMGCLLHHCYYYCSLHHNGLLDRYKTSKCCVSKDVYGIIIAVKGFSGHTRSSSNFMFVYAHTCTWFTEYLFQQHSFHQYLSYKFE